MKIMKNVMYVIGLFATVGTVFGGIIHYFGNEHGDSVILVAGMVAVACLFSIDALSKEETL
jgi:hypothetical protein